jgi:hypothetical protein
LVEIWHFLIGFYVGGSKLNMNKITFWIGIAKIVMAAILLLTVEEDLGMWPLSMVILGIVFISASGYKPMTQKKK